MKNALIPAALLSLLLATSPLFAAGAGPFSFSYGGRCLAAHVDLLERQEPLVEKDDRVVLEPKDSLRLEHAV